jgi:hypothetical protein
MATFAFAAGYVGWRRATKPIYRRLYVEVDPPDGMTRREYERSLRRRLKRWRIVITIFYALAGAVAGLLFLMLLARR